MPCYGHTPAWTHYTGITSAALVTTSPTYSFQAGWVCVPVTCRPSAAIPRRRHLVSYDVIFALLSPESVLFPEQTLSLGTKVSQHLVQKYGTVCRLQCLNNILNPTSLMWFETEVLRDSGFYGRHINLFYICMYVCMYIGIFSLAAGADCQFTVVIELIIQP